MLTCHIVLLCTNLYLSFVDILYYSYAAHRSKGWVYWIKYKMTFLSHSPEISSCKLGLSQRESCLPHNFSHLGLCLKKKKESKSTFNRQFTCLVNRYRNWGTDCPEPTDFNNFTQDLTETHGQGIRFLLEKIPAGLSPFKSSLHDGLGPVTENKWQHLHSLIV